MCALLRPPSMQRHRFDNYHLEPPPQAWAAGPSPNPRIPPDSSRRRVSPMSTFKNFLARFGRRSRNRFAPDGLEYYRDDKLYHGCSVVMSYTRLIFSPMSLLRARDCAKPLSALRLHRCAARALYILHKPPAAHFNDFSLEDAMPPAFSR